VEVRSLDDLDASPYVAPMVAELARRGRPDVGMRATLSSTVPPGAGLSSSTALEVAIAVSLAGVAGWSLPPQELAHACRDAEEAATGVPSGMMDQLASICGVAGCALLIDCCTFDVTPVPLPNDLAVLVVHSGVPRVLAKSEYAARRQACEEAAARIGVSSLRDATPVQVAEISEARHVVSENARVLAAADALRAGDVETLGRLFVASHESLRDDYRVSTPELDVLVEELVRAGAYGARLTGAGFGGCVVAISSRSRAEDVITTGMNRYRSAAGREPRGWLVHAVDGAGEVA
jgi:galactokinase